MYDSQNVSCYIVVLDRWPARSRRGARDFHVTLPARVYFLRSSEDAGMDSGEYVKRVEVSRSGQSLMLRVPDLSVSRLAAVFKVRILRVSIQRIQQLLSNAYFGFLLQI